jgi:flagellar biosynthesis anti-sigma factor FlgM
MRIDPKVVVSPTQLDTTKHADRRASASTAPGGASSVVELSSAAKSMRATEPTNTERLEKIRALLDAGEYAIDLDQLASRIVDDEVMRSRKPS